MRSTRHHHRPGRRSGRRRGLSLLELTLALAVTSLVAGAISSMLFAVSIGVDSNRDSRTLMIRGQAAQLRLSSYIAPSRCILGQAGTNIAIWLNDARVSETVHLTEIRWLRFDASTGELGVSYVSFPVTWTQEMIDLADVTLPRTSDWEAVYQTYATAGQIQTITLVDEISSIAVSTDLSRAQQSRLVQYEFTFSDLDITTPVSLSCGIRLHSAPSA